MIDNYLKCNTLKIKASKLGFWVALSVAVFTIVYIVALPLTFNFSAWKGIQDYAESFKSIQMFTVIPSILLASAFLMLSTCIHYYAPDEKKIWSHMGIVFSLVYAIICTTNYLIQIIAITPSLLNKELDGVTIFAPAYPNSIFFALMGSYIFMCIASFFISAVFTGGRLETAIRWSFFCTGLSGVTIIIGAFIGTFLIIPLSGGLWFISLTTGAILLAVLFRRYTIYEKRI